jgi:hypothetical protein
MMASTLAGEKYVLRRKFFRLFGAGFHVFDPQGNLVASCEQKAWRLREDIRIYADEAKTRELLRISTPHIIDFSATYTVHAGENALGSFKRSGLKSSFVRDEWLVFGPDGSQVALLREDSTWKALLRRYIEITSIFLPQRFNITNPSGQEIGSFRQRFNPFIYQLGIACDLPDEVVDDLLILALACVVAAIEDRQT